MLVLGIETSCDETGVALYDSAIADPARALLSQRLHTQAAMHEAYGGVVPELASRDHIRRLLPLLEGALADAGRTRDDLDAIAVTEGPGLVGALLVGSAFAHALGFALKIPVIGIHHLEGHLLSPLMSADAPTFPFVALLVSGGHTQLMRVAGVGDYAMLGETVDDAVGEAFDKTAKQLGLPYPGGPALARLAEHGDERAFALPRPMARSGDLDFSFSGLKTAVATAARRAGLDADGSGAGTSAAATAATSTATAAASIAEAPATTTSTTTATTTAATTAATNPVAQAATKADLAASFQRAAVDILVAKSMAALDATGATRIVIAGGVSANRLLRAELTAAASGRGARVHFPELEWCTDNGAMIALAGALRIEKYGMPTGQARAFEVRPRWPLA